MIDNQMIKNENIFKKQIKKMKMNSKIPQIQQK